MNYLREITPPVFACERSFTPTNTSVAFWSSEPNHSGPPGNLPRDTTPLIYAVDDMPCLAELYGLVLNASGYRVKYFNDRRAALANLESATEKPVLLITDLHNPSMRIEPFLEECVRLHPELRILMATGFSYPHAWCFSVKPDYFLQKPFTPEELQRAAEATLVGKKTAEQ